MHKMDNCFQLVLYSSYSLDSFFRARVNDSNFRLDPDDAGYVDIIHTDMSPRGSIVGLGMRRNAGHTDFL